jgi:hypothetical protein
MHTTRHPATMHAQAPGGRLILDRLNRLRWSVDAATDALRTWPARLRRMRVQRHDRPGREHLGRFLLRPRGLAEHGRELVPE